MWSRAPVAVACRETSTMADWFWQFPARRRFVVHSCKLRLYSGWSRLEEQRLHEHDALLAVL